LDRKKKVKAAIERESAENAQIQFFQHAIEKISENKKTSPLNIIGSLGLVAALIAIIGILIGLLYNSLNDRLKTCENDIRAFRSEIEVLKHKVQKTGTNLDTLDGTTWPGKVVFYKKGQPNGHSAEDLVCALSTTYSWKCEKDVLKNYRGKKIYLSFEGQYDNSLQF
jgi:hypothetical protein